MIKVQFDCGQSSPQNWINYDSSPSLFLSKIPFKTLFIKILQKTLGNQHPRVNSILKNILTINACYGDITKGLPLKSNSVDLLYASHILEHLPLFQFRLALDESLRILKPGGYFRIAVPDFSFFLNEYLNSNSSIRSIEFCLDTGLGKENFANIFSRMRGDSHHIMFDADAMLHELRKAGFSNARVAYYGDSDISDFREVEESYAWQTPRNIGFEAIK
jgi:SAM-dependent methyltransferase